MIAPVLDKRAPEFAGKVKIVKMNVDDNKATPAQFVFEDTNITID